MTLPSWLRSLVERTLGLGPVRTARRVLDAYGEAGGGLIAGGLTYSALFALVPILLVLTGVLGLAITDAARRAEMTASIGATFPPIKELIDTILTSISENAAGYGLLGIIGSVWGASHFYGSLDAAFARLFPGGPRRGFVARTLRGLLSVVLLIGLFFVVFALTGTFSALADEGSSAFAGTAAPVLRVVTAALTWLVFILATGFIYWVVPPRAVTVRAVWLPAVAAGLALALLTQLFSYIAPRLVGSAALYGTFVAIFAAMVWLSTGFQVLLIGAAWVRERSVDEEAADAAGVSETTRTETGDSAGQAVGG
ncbi:MAG TPA: YihY/virulence factor BrkB family protein [Candidatus Limnocylindrales bacterium]|jgi:membrane protein